MLIALFLALLAGGSDAIFLIPDLEDRIKKVVVEKEREKEFKSVFNEATREIKAFQKQKRTKELKELHQNRNTPKEDLVAFFKDAMNSRKVYQEKMVNYSLEIRSMLSADEYEYAILKGIDKSNKELNKSAKGQQKGLSAIENMIQQLKNVTQEAIENEKERNDAILVINEYEEKLIDLYTQITDYDYSDDERFFAQDISREELLDAYAELDSTREELYSQFIETRFKLVELTSEEEWKTISKQMGKVFN